MKQRKRKSPPYGILQFWYYILIGCALFVLCSVFIEKVDAKEVVKNEYLYTGAWSYHLNDPKRDEKNETHYLLAYNKTGVLVGTFKNSYYDQALLIGREINTWQYKDIQAGIYGGVVLGYWQCFGGKEEGDQMRNICPAIIPEIAYTKYKVQPSFMLLGKAAVFTIRWRIE